MGPQSCRSWVLPACQLRGHRSFSYALPFMKLGLLLLGSDCGTELVTRDLAVRCPGGRVPWPWPERERGRVLPAEAGVGSARRREAVLAHRCARPLGEHAAETLAQETRSLKCPLCQRDHGSSRCRRPARSEPWASGVSGVSVCCPATGMPSCPACLEVLLARCLCLCWTSAQGSTHTGSAALLSRLPAPAPSFRQSGLSGLLGRFPVSFGDLLPALWDL